MLGAGNPHARECQYGFDLGMLLRARRQNAEREYD
jgi:hypothetical protein